MSIRLYDPVGKVEAVRKDRERTLASLKGRKVGYLFNQHASALTFWKALEREVEGRLKPSSAHRVYKTNTWASVAQADADRLIAETDYALVGVGA